MKIGKIDLTGKNLIIALSVSCAIIALAIYMTVYAPLLKEMGVKYSECRASEGRLADANELIKSVGNSCGVRVLMKESQISFAMDELAKHGKAMGVHFISIAPKSIEDVRGADYKILPVQMEVEASGENFSDFIGTLENQKKTVIKVESFNLVPEEKDRTRLKAKLVINMYISKREDAD